ncbi:hypothetical protein GCM10007420_06800 [Glycocaulis albus]|uniref:DUF2975 domain-containing protein n=1 Tax=Glycocaulis albus TaxID=1382801 RepID=A0ABQ1XHV6_9PROT|nr:hypothetical protein [Glycocaulis albus]MBV5258709.1 hypothetical protein [Synechococcus moorigangaii CMS01]GGG93978.1 hypothetical protein GCM10007420_06800 [Glycocaulis albus]
MSLFGRYALAIFAAALAMSVVSALVLEVSLNVGHSEPAVGGHWFDDPHFHRTGFFFALSAVVYLALIAAICVPVWTVVRNFWPSAALSRRAVRGAVTFLVLPCCVFVLFVLDNAIRFDAAAVSMETAWLALDVLVQLGVPAAVAGALFGILVGTSEGEVKPA